MSEKKKFETLAVRTQTERSQHREHATPIFATSSFMFEDAEQARALFANEQPGNIYSRFSNPTVDEFIEKMCLLEGTEDGFATATGMAAMYLSMISFLKNGDHLLASRSVFGSTHQIITQILPRFGITHTYIGIDASPEAWEAAVQPNTKMVFVETPSNPALDLIDLEWLGQFTKSHNIILNVDNCFATPYLQNPAKYGADIVTHSATKFIDGQGRVLGGAVLGSKELMKEVRFMGRQTGPAMSPFNAWVLTKSLETLAVRLDRHCENALKLAQYLKTNEQVKSVKYPFLFTHPQHKLAKKQMKLGGGLVTFEVKGGVEQGRRFLDALKMCSLTANLGDTRTIATHPASTTHSKLTDEARAEVGIMPGLIRVSVGLEHISDTINDISQALAVSAAH